jgi:hypothetical protein
MKASSTPKTKISQDKPDKFEGFALLVGSLKDLLEGDQCTAENIAKQV